MPETDPGSSPATGGSPAGPTPDGRRLIDDLVAVVDAPAALQDAVPRLAAAIGDGLSAEVVTIWIRDGGLGRLRCVAVWSNRPADTKEFDRLSRDASPAEGEGLPGRAWRSRVPVWSADPSDDPRLEALGSEGVEWGACATPLVAGDRLVGVIEVLGRRVDADVALQRILVGLATDLGAALGRRIAEEAAGTARARLEVALAAGEMGVWDWDLVTNRLRWSDGLEDIMGLDRGSFAGTVEAYVELIHPEDREWVVDSYLQQFEHGGDDHIRIEHRFVRPDGTAGWLQVRGRATSLAGGDLTSMTGVAIDITDRVAREQAARTQRAQLDLAASVTGLGAWSWDRRTGLAHWSAELAAMAGLDPVETDLPLADALATIHPDDAGLGARFTDAAEAGGDLHAVYRVVRPDGEVRRFETWGRPLHDVTGELIGLAGITRDVTEPDPE